MNRTQKLTQLVTYTALPLVGLFFFGWDWRSILILYWLENVAVGLRALIEIIRAPTIVSADDTSVSTRFRDRYKDTSLPTAKFFAASYFMFNYGIFALGHGIFVALLVLGVFSNTGSSHLNLSAVVLFWSVGATIQGARVLLKPKSEIPSLVQSVAAPYKRIVPLHMAIVLGAFAVSLFDFPATAAVILILIHAAADLLQIKSDSSAF